jgi:glycosyltransferase involved in cell wall biosynthesis
MLGFIARCDKTGLGVESVEFVQHMMPEKLLVALPKLHCDMPEQFANHPDVAFLDRFPSPEEADKFLDGLDTLFCIEEPYDWSLLVRAQARKVRTVLRINYEYLPEPTPPGIDVMVAPVDWYQPPGTVILPFPLNRRRFPFRKRTRAHTFVHIGGRLGMHGRNGTKELLQAIPLVKSDVRFIIYSQRKLEIIDDPRIEWHFENVADNSVLFQEGDVMIFPRRYAGQALSVNESLSVGMPVIMTNMRPQNAFLLPELMFPYQSMESIHLERTIEFATLDPVVIAAKIDEFAGKDISGLSGWANRYAETLSWETLMPRYVELLCPGRLAGAQPQMSQGAVSR